MNGAGARYPWMVSYDGTEQCESWDIGCSEVHVTADVAYALGQYLDWTGDDSLFFQGGAQVLVETARFWVSRYSPAPEAGRSICCSARARMNTAALPATIFSPMPW